MRSVLESAAPSRTVVSSVPDWAALADGIKQTSPSTVSVVDPYFGTAGARLAPELRELLHRFPSASVISALDVRQERARDVALLDAWGVAGIITSGHDDTPAAIEQRLAEACAWPLKRLVGSILPPELSPHAYALILAAADVTCDGGKVADFSEALGASPSSLLRRAEEAGLPTPRTLLQWMRILLAAKLLEEPERGIEDVARNAGCAGVAPRWRSVSRRSSAVEA